MVDSQVTLQIGTELDLSGLQRDLAKLKSTKFDFDIDPKTCNYQVISFLLQPFVENAIKFGMKTSEMPLKINISSALENGSLKLVISNTGKWIEPDEISRENENGKSTGTGLRNAEQRLKIAYPNRHDIDFDFEGGIVKVTIIIRKGD